MDEVFKAFFVDAAAAEAADNAAGDGVLQPEGVADRNDEVAHFSGVAVRHGQFLQFGVLHAQHGDVGGCVLAHHFRLELPVVLGGDRDFGGVFDDMGVGDQVALLRVHDNAGTSGTEFTLGRAFGHVEEAAEERVVHEWVALGAHFAASLDVHHGRRNALHHGRE